MERSHCPTSKNLPLGRLVADALSEIERLGYSRRSRNRYRATWEHLIAFARGKELGDELSAELAASFLEEYGVRDGQVDGPGNGWRRHMVIGVKVLADFGENGRIGRVHRDVQAVHLPPATQNTLCDYEQYCKDRLHLQPSTLRLRTTESALQQVHSFCVPQRVRTHCSVQTRTLVSCFDEIFLKRANLEMKRNALEKITESSPVQTIPCWQQNKDLLDWLRSL